MHITVGLPSQPASLSGVICTEALDVTPKEWYYASQNYYTPRACFLVF
jgi:hypothetical protein